MAAAIFLAGFYLPLFKQFSGHFKQPDLYRCASNVNSDTLHPHGTYFLSTYIHTAIAA